MMAGVIFTICSRLGTAFLQRLLNLLEQFPRLRFHPFATAPALMALNPEPKKPAQLPVPAPVPAISGKA
jgi:hypothetical protein